MQIKLASWLREVRGKVEECLSVRTGKNGNVHVYRWHGKREARGGTVEGNERLREASKRARELLEDEGFRRRMEAEMAAWNRRFPEDWARRTAHRGKAGEHPYVSVYHYVVGRVMRGEV